MRSSRASSGSVPRRAVAAPSGDLVRVVAAAASRRRARRRPPRRSSRRRRRAAQRRLGRGRAPRLRARRRPARAARRAIAPSSTSSAAATETSANANDARSRTLRYAERAASQRRRQLDGRDQLAGVEHRVAARARRPGGGSSSAIGIAPLAGRRRYVHDARRARRARPPCPRDGWRRTLGMPEDREVAVVTRRAPGSRLPGSPLVARLGDVLEVDAAGALEQVAADRRHVAQLTGGARRAAPGRAPGSASRTRWSAARSLLRHRGADPQPAVGHPVDPVERKPRDVDEQRRASRPPASSGRRGSCRRRGTRAPGVAGQQRHGARPRSSAALVARTASPALTVRRSPGTMFDVGAAAAQVAAHALADLVVVEHHGLP